ncbi:hypothetical protein RND81_01G099700 [Saponaria officinalis]|uniref:Reverse transcriptase domain-containing protein n=1 Tax=Saponaria officinalis TaxID=3572 RepID=A0AAW1N6L0_SAPOF
MARKRRAITRPNFNRSTSITSNTGTGASGSRPQGSITVDPPTSFPPVLSPFTGPQVSPVPESFSPLNLGHLEGIGEECEQEGGEGWRIVGRRGVKTEQEQMMPEIKLRLEESDVRYVLGGNPPMEVLSGFIKRIWGRFGYDKLSFRPNGVFIVRFKDKETQQSVLQQGYPLFDGKPVVVKPWSPDESLDKEMVQTVPTWVRLHDLDLKFWGEGCLWKIASLIGDPIKLDDATSLKLRLGFARILVEVPLGEKCLDQIVFADEKDQIHEIKLSYDWKPVLCKKCKGFGHEEADCRKGRTQPAHVWRPVQRSAPVTAVAPVTENADASVPGNPTVIGRVGSDNGMVTPGLCGLVETRVRSSSFNKVARAFEADWCIETNLDFCERGRIWVMWRKGLFGITVIAKSVQAIHCSCTHLGSGWQFYMTVVYGLHTQVDRESLWSFLGSVYTQSPWLVAGDFNNVLQTNERIGAAVQQAETVSFQTCLQICELMDMKTVGMFFTWNNKQDEDNKVMSKIDRVLMNGSWFSLFPEAFVEYQPEGLFDHSPGVVTLLSCCARNRTSFKFLNMWVLAPCFHDLVEHNWREEVNGVPMYQVVTKLRRLKNPLKQINRKFFYAVEQRADIAMRFLYETQRQVNNNPYDLQLREVEKMARSDCLILERARLSYLRQKAKCDWIRGADANSAFFHARIKARRIINRVIQIHDTDGIVHCQQPDIEDAFLRYYKSLLGSSAPTVSVNSRVVVTAKVITDAHTQILCHKVTNEEIKAAIFSIPDDKTPGPDGFTSPEVCAAVKYFFVHRRLLRQINATTICLVPKCSQPISVLDFRPIACCNVIYKCIANLLCNRLGDSAFLKGRPILENVLICQDLVRLYSRGVVSPRCLVKIDIRKAYDSLEWKFLCELLLALRFPSQFVELIKSGFFSEKRGLRQGDPLPPLLFTISMDYLSRILNLIRAEEEFRYHPMCKILKLNHLCTPAPMELLIRGDSKSCAYFNGVSTDTRLWFLNAAGMSQGQLPFKYLGVLVAKVSVLQTVQSYWSSIFVLPKKFIKQIDAKCRNFLWEGTAQSTHAPPVAWDKVCSSKNAGGLGLKNLSYWNMAAVGKLVWWLVAKADRLWVQWVHHVYLKGVQWADYMVGLNCSWSWRRICTVMTVLKLGFITNVWSPSTIPYTVKEGYAWLTRDAIRVRWHNVIWTRLYTKDRQVRLGLQVDFSCCLCGAGMEDHAHLFFSCSWLGRPVGEDWNWSFLKQLRNGSMLKRFILYAAFSGLIHHVWDMRNVCRIHHYVKSPNCIARDIKFELKVRLESLQCNWKVSDREWLRHIGLL